jgi:hypothetical protein
LSRRDDSMIIFTMKILFLWFVVIHQTYCIPQTIKVKPNSKECLYEVISDDEALTASLFIVSGAELKGTLLLEGPLTRDEIKSGIEMQALIDRHEKGTHIKEDYYQKIEEDISFEQLFQEPQLDSNTDIDDDNAWKETDDDKMENEAVHRRAEERKRHARAARKRLLENRQKNAGRSHDGESFERTLRSKSKGLYRACVKGSWYEITAEMELRKESELGGIDQETNHVFTYAKKEENQETRFLEEDSALLEAGAINDEDFEMVKQQMKRLRQLLNAIQNKQSIERHRLIVHASTNEHSHSRMVLSNLFETVLFMLVTGYQIYTIRKWFTGNVLSR